MRLQLEATPEESAVITRFCKEHGYIKSQWLKRIAMQTIARANGQGDGSQQARDMAAAIGGQG